VCEASYPYLVSKALEAALNASQGNAAPAGSVSLWQALCNVPPELVSVLALLAVNAFGETLFASLRAVCASLITNSTLKRLRSTVFAALLQQEKLWFQRKGYDAASLASRVTGDCEAVAKIVSINFNVALRYGVQSVGALMFLVYLSPLIAAYCVVSAVLMSVMSLKYVSLLFWILECATGLLHAFLRVRWVLGAVATWFLFCTCVVTQYVLLPCERDLLELCDFAELLCKGWKIKRCAKVLSACMIGVCLQVWYVHKGSN
jgi:ABC-type multidrug transport system fused ATPase/permease subunit